MKRASRYIALLLAALMCLSLLPVSAWADAEPETGEEYVLAEDIMTVPGEPETVEEPEEMSEPDAQEDDAPPKEEPLSEDSPVPIETEAGPALTEETPVEDEEMTAAPEEIVPASETPVPAEENVSASAAEAAETEEEEPAVQTLGEIEQTVDLSGLDMADNDDLFSDYVDRMFFGQPAASAGGPRRAPRLVGNSLTGLNGALYGVLKSDIAAVAAGTETTTVFTYYIKALDDRTYWTAEDLGLEYVYQKEGEKGTYNPGIGSAFLGMINGGLIMNALLADCPYELYWFNKTVGLSFSLAGSYTAALVGGEYKLKADELYYKFSFAVAEDYAGNEAYNVRSDVGASVQMAVTNANTVVADNGELGDYEKLKAYRDYICDAVSYYSDAAGGGVPYGDPWQLIWVFDGDPTTNVVCEGYSKAFQYLCDLSRYDYDDEIVCISVVGAIPAGAHMWNIVTMPDGGRYLVDVTNCDGGNRDRLFLKGAPDGSVETGYTVGSLKYTYSADTLGLFPAEDLTLTGKDYDPELTLPDEPISLEGAEVSVVDQIYTGEAIIPSVTVILDGKELAQNIHFTVSAENNVECGNATATITGIRRYTGTIDHVVFSITQVSLEGALLTAPAQTYTGDALTPMPTVTLDGKTLTAGTDYTVSYENNTEPGTATVTVTGIGNYTGTVSGTFRIDAASLSGASVTAPAQTYTGDALTPMPTVTLDGKTLTAGTDYTVSYENNTEPGTATVTVTGIGNYTGTASETFRIEAASLSGASVTAEPQYYTAAALTPVPAVTLNGRTLEAGTDYTVSYENNTDAGTAAVTVTGIGNYTGTASGNFRIDAASLSGASVTAATQYYTAAALTPVPAVTLNGRTLEAGTDFTATYDNNTAVGTASFTVTGRGNYTGTAAGSFPIRALDTPKVSAAANSVGGVKVSWSAVTGAVKYRVFRRTAGGSWKKLGDTTETSYVDAKAKNGTKYYYTVRCVSENGKTYTSKYNTTGKAVTYLAAPKVKSVTNAASGLTVKWSKVSGATGYVLYRRAAGASKWTKVKTISGGSTVSYTDTKVKSKSGTTYYYTVRAVKGKVLSGYDPEGRGLLRLANPKLSSAKASAAGVTVKWKKVTGAQGYYVYRRTAGGKWKKIATVQGGTTLRYVDAKAKSGITYSYTVRAFSDSTMSLYNTTGKTVTAK